MTQVQTKTTTDILAEQLAALSADIKPKVGKTARETAEGIASSYIRTEKGRLNAEFHAWVVEGMILSLYKPEAAAWRKYNDAIDFMLSKAERIGPSNSEYANITYDLRRRVSFDQFYTGLRSESDARSAVHKAAASQVAGFKQRKASLDKRLAELDAVMAATKKAIWRTYRNPVALTVSGNDLGKQVADIIKGAIGLPAIAAPAIEPEVITA
jgi:hypothetical protein